MLDISDASEAGVRLIVYADDIVVYDYDPDETRVIENFRTL